MIAGVIVGGGGVTRLLPLDLDQRNLDPWIPAGYPALCRYPSHPPWRVIDQQPPLQTVDVDFCAHIIRIEWPLIEMGDHLDIYQAIARCPHLDPHGH